MTAGTVNGTDIHLRMKIGGVWVFIGGQKTHTETISNNPIDITNKGSNSFRELMNKQGLQTNDITAEFVFNSDEAFEALDTAAKNKTIEQFQIFRGTKVSELFMKVASVARTAPDNDALTASVSLVSTSAFTQDIPVTGQFPTANFTFVPTLLSVAFTDTSTDPDGTITAWFWDFGDDNNSSLQNPTNVFAASGDYDVKLTISDNDGNSSEIIKVVTV